MLLSYNAQLSPRVIPMNRAIYPILSGAIAHERRMHVFANNLANVNTTGFKQDDQGFQAILTRRIAGPGFTPGVRTIAQQIVSIPAGPSERVFAAPHFVRTSFEAGRARITGNPLDVAIQSDGFFEVKTAQGLRYTRNGKFSLDNQHRLVTHDGNPVMGTKGEIKIPPGNLEINGVGTIMVDGQAVANLKIMSFADKEMPQKHLDGLFAGDKGHVHPHPTLQAGHIEESNVNALGEMVKIIQGMRTYESAQKLIQTIDRMAEVAIQDVGRVL